jgi:hypothetical protein
MKKWIVFILILIVLIEIAFIFFYQEEERCPDLICYKDGKYTVDWVEFAQIDYDIDCKYLAPNSTVKTRDLFNDSLPVKASINQFQFRGKQISLEKPEGVKRIILAGDSFVFGQGLPDNETIAIKLEEKFNSNGYNVEVLNIAYPGLSAPQIINWVQEKGLPLDPDLIVIFYFSNDYDEPCFHYKLNIEFSKNFSGEYMDFFTLVLDDYNNYYNKEINKDFFNERIFQYYDQILDNNVVFYVWPDYEERENLLIDYFEENNLFYMLGSKTGHDYSEKWMLTKHDNHPNPYTTKVVSDFLFDEIKGLI